MDRLRIIGWIRHSQQVIAVSVLALCACLPGCKSTDIAPSPGMGDPWVAPLNDPQISILSPELRNWLGFQPAIIFKDGEHPMSVEAPMRNLTYNRYFIEYRFLFYDQYNRQLEPQMGWVFQPLDPKQVVRLTGKALTDDAETYRLEVRWSR